LSSDSEGEEEDEGEKLEKMVIKKMNPAQVQQS
jgi:hypothetical protein